MENGQDRRDYSALCDRMDKMNATLIRSVTVQEGILREVQEHDNDIKILTSKMAKAEGGVSSFKWFAGLGGGAGLVSFLQSIFKSQ